PYPAPDQSTLRRSTEALGGRACGPAEVVPCGGQAASERVEHQQPRLLHGRRRHLLQLQVDDEASEAPRGGERHVGPPPRLAPSTPRIASWMRPLLATRAGASMSSAPPVKFVTRPPASSTRRLPAATSQGPRRSSQ